MTPETINAGVLMVAAVLIAAGYGLVRVGASAWAERRAVRAHIQSVETAEVMAFLRELSDHIDAEQADWEEWLGRAPGFDRPPLASVTPLPLSPRVLNFPAQRKPGGAS